MFKYKTDFFVRKKGREEVFNFLIRKKGREEVFNFFIREEGKEEVFNFVAVSHLFNKMSRTKSTLQSTRVSTCTHTGAHADIHTHTHRRGEEEKKTMNLIPQVFYLNLGILAKSKILREIWRSQHRCAHSQTGCLLEA